MNTPTPRTDAACGFFDMDTAVSADFARELERENEVLKRDVAAAVAEFETGLTIIKEKDAEIARLRSATLTGRLIKAGTFSVGDEVVTGYVVQTTVEALRAVPSLPMYCDVAIVETTRKAP